MLSGIGPVGTSVSVELTGNPPPDEYSMGRTKQPRP